MYILGVNTGNHDASACLFKDFDLLAAVSLERLTRVKDAGVTTDEPMPNAAIDECLAIAGIGRGDVDVLALSRALFEYQQFALTGLRAVSQAWYRLRGRRKLRMVERMMRKEGNTDASAIFRTECFLAREGFGRARLHFYNHHLAHGLPAFFYSGFDEALIHTADGYGDGVSYSARIGRRSGVELLFGGDEALFARREGNSLGLLYGRFTAALGFIASRHEGKVVGLAAHGRPVAAERIASLFRVEETGRIRADLRKKQYAELAAAVCRDLSRSDAAASIQEAAEVLMTRSIAALLKRTNLRNLAVGGGVYANVRLNRHLLENTAADAIFIFPAMGDGGLPVGGCLDYLLQQRGPEEWQRNRRVLDSMLLGRDHRAEPDALAAAFPKLRLSPIRESDAVVAAVADALVAGKAVGIHDGRMEFGPRALGARSILASPTRREINDSLNARLSRSDFMPFAPVVLSEYAEQVFDIHAGNKHAAHFMTITCDVQAAWRDRIPAVVHIDGSARPQIVDPEPRTLYRRILEAWHSRSGIPVLVNTSFNVHEEPIVDTPEQALIALEADRVDLLVLNGRIFER
ncbi:MAG TPA: carbamoyltransferase C-terminal domain-containing protein [Roseiarcus sp.]|jgi:carbamoyltransferase